MGTSPSSSTSQRLLSRTHLRVLFIILSLVFISLLITTTHAYTLLGEREIRLSSSEPGATADYQVDFDVSTAGDLGGIVITFCADSPIINDTDCEAPDNFNLTNQLANLNLGDIDLTDYTATTSQHVSSGAATNTVTLTPQSIPDAENWDEITNSNVSLPGTGWTATFTSDEQVLVLAHAGGDYVTFVDSSDPNPANWTEITNNNVSLPGTGRAATFTSDDQVLVLVHADGDHVTFVDSSDPNPANWTEITNNNVNLPGTGYAATFTSDDQVLVLAHRDVFACSPCQYVTFVDSSDPNPANWDEITNNNVSLPGVGFAATFTSDEQVLVLAHAGGDYVTFVDSSDPNPANWTEITNNNVSLPGTGYAATFTSDDQVLVLGHVSGDGAIFVDSSDSNPANWTTITNNNVSLPGGGLAATFTSDDQVLVLAHWGGDNVTFVDTSAAITASSAATASGDSATFELLNARNPSSLGTFYARIYTYADPEHALDYTLANPSAGGSVIDAGGIALSTADLLTIESKVQERLTFCLFTDNLSSPADYETCAKPAPDPVLLGDSNGVLSPNQPSIANNTHYNITTNASAGATIRAKMNTLTAGSFSIDPVGDVTPGDGVQQASTPGSEQFGFCTFTQSSSVNTDLTPLAPYNHSDCENTIAGQAINNDQGAQFAFNEDNLLAPPANPYGDAIAEKPAGDWSTGTIALLANIGTTTEPGIYTTTMELIATGRY